MKFLNEGLGAEVNKIMKGGKRSLEQVTEKMPCFGLRVPEGSLEVLKNGEKEIDWEGLKNFVKKPLSEEEQYWLKRRINKQKEVREVIKKEKTNAICWKKNGIAKIWAELGGSRLRKIMIEKAVKNYSFSEEDKLIARTIGAFRTANLDEEVTLIDSLSFELEREDEAAHSAFDSSFESHWLWLNDGPITIVGEKEIKKAFVADCWSEYDDWTGELKETRGSNLSFPEIWQAKAVKEELIMSGVRWAENHSEIFAHGKFNVKEVIINPKKIKEEELINIIIFLENKKINWSFYYWNEEKEKEVRKELNFDWYESLIPANSKISLWD